MGKYAKYDPETRKKLFNARFQEAILNSGLGDQYPSVIDGQDGASVEATINDARLELRTEMRSSAERELRENQEKAEERSGKRR